MDQTYRSCDENTSCNLPNIMCGYPKCPKGRFDEAKRLKADLEDRNKNPKRKFEYKFIDLPLAPPLFQNEYLELLNREGNLGWELVENSRNRLLMKREV